MNAKIVCDYFNHYFRLKNQDLQLKFHELLNNANGAVGYLPPLFPIKNNWKILWIKEIINNEISLKVFAQNKKCDNISISINKNGISSLPNELFSNLISEFDLIDIHSRIGNQCINTLEPTIPKNIFNRKSALHFHFEYIPNKSDIRTSAVSIEELQNNLPAEHGICIWIHNKTNKIDYVFDSNSFYNLKDAIINHDINTQKSQSPACCELFSHKFLSISNLAYEENLEHIKKHYFIKYFTTPNYKTTLNLKNILINHYLPVFNLIK